MNKYKVLLGGLGDDAHSIGSNLIRLALGEQGYDVSYIGIQNTIHDFIKYSRDHEIIIISCINGHSELYLDNDEYELKGMGVSNNKLWYVGGNLSVNKSNDYIIKTYKERGFTTVMPKAIPIEELLALLKQDIEKYNIFPENYTKKSINFTEMQNGLIEQVDVLLDDDNFESLRRQILGSWVTGEEVSYDTAKENHKGTTNMAKVLQKASSKYCSPIIQPRTGVADHNKQYELLDTLRVNGIGIASIQLDAASRRNNFIKAKEGLERSIGTKVSALNGYPIPIHGMQGVNKLAHMPNLPFQIRGGAPDHRFVYEVGLAGGASGVEGGFLSYLLPYDKSVSPFQSLMYWNYIDKLCSKYNKLLNIKINREFFGPLTTTLLEPSIPISINIVEALSAAFQGVKSISVGIAEQGNRSQDIAAVRTLDKLTNSYLKKYGYNDVQVTTVYHQYMGAFPQNENKAENLIEQSSVTAVLSGATRIMTKTPVEAFKIPDVYDNIRGIELTKKGICKARDIKVDNLEIQKEVEIVETEVNYIMKMIELLGNGSIELGAIKAVQQGILDVPFSPNVYNKGESVGFRSLKGAIRFAKHENLPFPEWIKDIHNEELYFRMEYERDYKLYSIIEKDLVRITKGEYQCWPLNRLEDSML